MTAARPRTALLGPLAPEPSGIADYTEELLPHLARHFDLHLFSGYPERPAPRSDFPSRGYLEYARSDRERPFELRIYQFGNSVAHHPLFALIALYPGIVVLHETSLHRVRAHGLLGDAMPCEYVREAAYCHGPEGRRAARLVAGGYGSDLLFGRLPLLRLVLESAAGVLVHGPSAARELEGQAGDLPIGIAPSPFAPPPGFPVRAGREEARRRLGIGPEAFVVGCFGRVTAAKGVLDLIGAAARAAGDVPELRLHLVGPPDPGFDPAPHVRRCGAAGRVLFTGPVGLADFHWHILACDLAFNWRHPTMGESSATLIRVMGLGRPAVVPDYRQFRDEPRAAVIHLPLEASMEEPFAAAIAGLYRQPDRLRAVGAAARELTLRRNRPEATAAGYAELAHQVLARPPRTPLAARTTLPHLRLPGERAYRRAVELLRAGGAGRPDHPAAAAAWRAMTELGIVPGPDETIRDSDLPPGVATA